MRRRTSSLIRPDCDATLDAERLQRKLDLALVEEDKIGIQCNTRHARNKAEQQPANDQWSENDDKNSSGRKITSTAPILLIDANSFDDS